MLLLIYYNIIYTILYRETVIASDINVNILLLLDADVARDVICLIKCLRMIGESVTMDMAVLMETSCYNLQSPEKAAEHILEDLITIDV